MEIKSTKYADSVATLKLLTEDVGTALMEMYLICAENDFNNTLTASFTVVNDDDDIVI